MKFTGSVALLGITGNQGSGSGELLLLAVGTGQSLIVDMNKTSFTDQGGAGSTFIDSAENGTALNKSVGDQLGEDYWVDNDGALADGNLFTAMLADVDASALSRSDINCVVHQQWNAERSYVTETGAGAGEVTPAEYEASLDYLISRFRAEFGSDVKIIFGLPHRRTSATAQHDYACQKMREIYAGKADSDANIFAVEHCDIDLTDATHHTIPGRAEFGERMGLMANYALNGGTAPDYPVLQSATIDYGTITAVFDSDITAPSTGVGQCAAAQNFTSKAGASLTRASDSTATFTLSDNVGIRIDDTPEFRIGNGVNASLASTSADTLNNASGTLPARGKTVAITDGNAISSIADVKEYWDAKYSTKVYSSGSIVSTIEGIKGAGMEAHPSGVGATYDSTLFGNRGGLKAHTGTSGMQLIDTFTSGTAHTIFLVMDIPASPSNYYFGGFSTQDSGFDSNARFRIFSNGDIGYSRDQSAGFPSMVTDPRGTQGVFALRYTSNSNLDYYWNDTTKLGSIDPIDNFNNETCLALWSNGGASEPDLIDFGVGGFVYANTDLTDSEMTTIITELATEYGITLS